MGKTEKKLSKLMQCKQVDLSSSKQLQRFIKASADFEALVKKGVIKKRGYNLLSLSDAQSTNKVLFNNSCQ